MPREVFSFQSTALPPSVSVLAFRGVEAVSRPYEFELFLLVRRADSEDLDLATVVGRSATLAALRDDGTRRTWTHGVIATFELMHELPGDALYRAVLVPRLWALSLAHHSQVFHDKSLPDVVETVLRDHGLSGDDVAMRLTRSYRPLEHCCQYKESPLDFIGRLLEREGIYYWFEQGEEREKLVISDSRPYTRFEGSAGAVRFLSSAGSGSSVEALQSFRVAQKLRPTAVTVRDHDYVLDREARGESPVSSTGVHSVHRYGENVMNGDDARRIAAVRAGESANAEHRFSGAGRVFDLRAGYEFELFDHPRAALNARYVCTALRHLGNHAAGRPEVRELLGITERDEDVYRVEVEAISASEQLRPERRSPIPRIYGVESAVVDGPADSDYAQLDEHGRYRVKVRFDERDSAPGRASAWVRMLQPHAGNPEGLHFPLRKGTEVMMIFLGGDPDRPMITGAAPNASTPSVVTAANHTQNIFHTGGDNHFELEDLSGSQHIVLFSPTQNSKLSLGAIHSGATHNTALTTDGTGLIHTGGNHDRTVGGAMTEDVVGSVAETYHSTHDITVDGHRTETITSGQTQTINAGSTETVNGGQTRTVTGGVTETISGGRTQTVNGGHTGTVNGGLTQTVNGGDNITVNAGRSLTINGGTTEVHNGGLTQNITGTLNVTVSGGTTITSPAGVNIIAPAGIFELAPSIHNEVHVHFTQVAASADHVKGFNWAINGINLALNGVNSSVNGVNLSADAVKLTLPAIKVDIGGLEARMKGLLSRIDGTALGVFGIKVEI